MRAISSRTVREYYRVGASTFDSAEEAVKAAFRRAADENYRSITVERVTVHDPVDGGVWGEITETVTGRLVVDGPATLSRSPELSRYHPVNGWVIPEAVEVER